MGNVQTQGVMLPVNTGMMGSGVAPSESAADQSLYYGRSGGSRFHDISRSGNHQMAMKADSMTGRPDLQVMSQTAVSLYPNISGDVAKQVSAQLYSESEYAAGDPLPMGAMTRFNRFASTDLRGDPDYHDEDASVNVPTRFGGSEEFLQKRVYYRQPMY